MGRAIKYKGVGESLLPFIKLIKNGVEKEKKIVQISYDVLGRRIQKLFNSGAYRNYIYSNQDVILEENYSKEHKLKNSKEFIYGNSTDDILSMNLVEHKTRKIEEEYVNNKGKTKTRKIKESYTETSRYYYEKDHLGSIVAITDESATIVEEYVYDVFGKPYTKHLDGKITGLKKSPIGNTRLYTGREYDRGLKLYYNRARYYNPQLGRFISRDPIDIADDINLYAYVGNNSVMFVDRMGLEKILILLTIDKNGIIPEFDENGYFINIDEFTSQRYNTLIHDLKTKGKKYDTKVISTFSEFDFAINEKNRESVYLIGHGSKNSIALNSDKNIEKSSKNYINNSNLKNDTNTKDLTNTILYLYSCNVGRDGNEFLSPDPIAEEIQDHYNFKATYGADTFMWGGGQIFNPYNPLNWLSDKFTGEPIIKGKMIEFN